jgi:hypothetical protein
MDVGVAAKIEVFVPSWDRTSTSGRLDHPFDRLRGRLFKVHEFYYLVAAITYTNSCVNVQTTLFAFAR